MKKYPNKKQEFVYPPLFTYTNTSTYNVYALFFNIISLERQKNN